MVEAREHRIDDKWEYNPNLSVYTSWDFGMDDVTSIWFFQMDGTRIHWIDYYENSSKALDFYINVLEARRIQKKYKYIQHIVPHDGGKRELTSGISAKDVAAKMGYEFSVVKRTPRRQLGIQAVRSLFPRFYFHSTNCAQGIKALEDYHRKFDEETQTYANSPAHSWSSHAADSIRTFAEGLHILKTAGGTMTSQEVSDLESRYAPRV
jgi:hypothetical protein